LKAIQHHIVILGFNYKAHNSPAYKFNTSATFFGYGHPDVLSGTGILAIGGHLPVLGPYFHCSCAESAVSELTVEILT